MTSLSSVVQFLSINFEKVERSASRLKGREGGGDLGRCDVVYKSERGDRGGEGGGKE